MIMKARTISILLVATLAVLVCSHLGEFDLSNTTAEASLLPEKLSFRTYVESVTVTITLDGITKRLFERKIMECLPSSREEVGIPTGELFDYVYENAGRNTLEKYDREQIDAMTDIALDDLEDNEYVLYDQVAKQWMMTPKGNYEYRRMLVTE
jgi:hypothetical protein